MDLESPMIAMAGSMIAMMDDGSNVLQHAHHLDILKETMQGCTVSWYIWRNGPITLETTHVVLWTQYKDPCGVAL